MSGGFFDGLLTSAELMVSKAASAVEQEVGSVIHAAEGIIHPTAAQLPPIHAPTGSVGAAPSASLGVASPLGQPGSDLLSLPAQIAEFQARWKEVTRWKNVLASADKSMAQKAKATNLSKAVQVWTSTMGKDAISELNDAADAARGLQKLSAAGHAVPPSTHDDYISCRSAALADADKAISYAQRIYDAINEAWRKFAADGVPTASDYAMAAVTSLPPVAVPIAAYKGAKAVVAAAPRVAQAVVADARGVMAAAEGAGASVLNAAKGAVSETGTVLKWGAIGVGGLLFYLIYTAGKVAPTVGAAAVRAYIPNGRRRKRISYRKGRRRSS